MNIERMVQKKAQAAKSHSKLHEQEEAQEHIKDK